ncbi:MAG: hypothetical protein U0350_47340 [Caldilineaceae bacterium]
MMNKRVQCASFSLAMLIVCCATLFAYTPTFAQAEIIAAPLQVTLTAQSNQASLSWTDKEGDAHTQYTLYRSMDGEWADAVKMDKAIIGVGTGDSVAIDFMVIDDSLQPGATYTYWLVQETPNHPQIQVGPFVVTSHVVYLPLLMR